MVPLGYAQHSLCAPLTHASQPPILLRRWLKCQQAGHQRSHLTLLTLDHIRSMSLQEPCPNASRQAINEATFTADTALQ